MADTTMTIGSNGIVKKIVEVETGLYANSVAIGKVALYPSTPIVTVYSPTGVAYAKFTPNASNFMAEIRPRVTTESLLYAGLLTHKTADATSIGAADASDLATSKTLAIEILSEANVHTGSTTYHVAAQAAFIPGHKAQDTTTVAAADMSNLATGYTLIEELWTDWHTHTASLTYHQTADTAVSDPGVPDSEPLLTAKTNLLRTDMLEHMLSAVHHTVSDPVTRALVAATTEGSNEATTQTLINLLKSYFPVHFTTFDNTNLSGVVMTANSARAALLSHYNSTTYHGGATMGTADTTNYATLNAVAAATDLASAQTLLNAEKSTLNLHYVILDNGAYATVPGADGLPWQCLGPVWVRTSASGGVWTTSEWRSGI